MGTTGTTSMGAGSRNIDLDTFLALIPDGALVADLDGTIVAVNGRLEGIFGYVATDLVGAPVEMLLPAGRATAHVASRTAYVSHPVARAMAPDRHVAGRRRDGSEGDVEVSVNVLADAGLVVAVVRDVSRRRDSERELETWAHIWEHAGFGVVVGQPDSDRLARVNPAFAAMHGYEVAELVGMPLLDVFAPEVRGTVAGELDQVHRKGRHVFDSLHVRKDGTVFPVRIDATAVRDAGGRVLYRVALVEDLTERRRAEAALIAAGEDLRRHTRVLERVNAALRRESAIAENMAEGVALVRASDSVFVYVNPSWEAMFGYEPGELLGRPVTVVNAPGKRSPRDTADAIIAALRARGSWHGEIRNIRKDGSLLWCQANVSEFDDPEYGAVWVAVHTDITKRKTAEAALRASEERFRRVFEENPLGMAVVDTGRRLLQVNDALCEMTGYDAASLLGRRLDDLVADDDEVDTVLADVFAGTGSYHLEHRLMTRRGDEVWAQVRASVVPGSGSAPAYAIVMVEDITARKHAEARLAHLAMHDELTGLPNRSLAMDRLRQMQAASDRTHQHLAVLFVDLDGFKAVNDALGHEAGDAILVRVARRLEASLRPSDTAARLGGDEFIVCCENLGLDPMGARLEVRTIADRILAALAEPINLSSGHVRVAGSIGIVVTHGSATDAAALLRDADAAMYRAKARGTGQSEMFSRETPPGERPRIGRLNLAVERNELVVYYQPVVDLGDGRVAGAEALVRWHHPARGLLLPEEFLDPAERSGLIVPIGSWVLDHVLGQIARWREHRLAPPFVSVNVSAVQLDEPGFPDEVARLLAAHDVPAASLRLEIVEGRFIEAAEPVLTALEDLRSIGVQLGLDDFGTGWSSLTHLQRFPVDFLKIDRSFVGDLETNGSSRAIVTALIGLARSLGLDVIGEGIESEEQAALLAGVGCRLGQGWLYGRGEPAADFARRLPVAPLDPGGDADSDPSPGQTSR